MRKQSSPSQQAEQMGQHKDTKQKFTKLRFKYINTVHNHTKVEPKGSSPVE